MTADTQQYFTHDPESLSREKAFRLDWKGRSFSFVTDNGVFSKGELDTGTAVLLNALPESFSGRLLDLGQGADQVGVDRNRDAGDREILQRTQRLDAVISICRNIAIAEQVVFFTGLLRHDFLHLLLSARILYQ